MQKPTYQIEFLLSISAIHFLGTGMTDADETASDGGKNTGFRGIIAIYSFSPGWHSDEKRWIRRIQACRRTGAPPSRATMVAPTLISRLVRLHTESVPNSPRKPGKTTRHRVNEGAEHERTTKRQATL